MFVVNRLVLMAVLSIARVGIGITDSLKSRLADGYAFDGTPVNDDGRRVRGTIHWIDASESVDAEVRLYDRLFRKP